MSRRELRDRDGSTVSAKELAEMGFCEKRVLLEHRHRRRLTFSQQQAMEGGRRAHAHYYREGVAARSASAADRRCFVAACLFGVSAWETVNLRRYRDAVLRRSRWGGVLVDAYYTFAPIVCVMLRRWPCLQRPMRAVVGAVARRAQRRLAGQRES